MNALLEQFLSESRESLQGIGEKLLQLEKEPASEQLMTELFRFVHTLKGNSGLFDFPELTRVLHAGEDLMDAVRNGKVPYCARLADLLLDAMDFVGVLCDEIERQGSYGASYGADSARLAETLRQMIGVPPGVYPEPETPVAGESEAGHVPLHCAEIPEETRQEARRRLAAGESLHFIVYRPAEECFFQGDDPFFQARQTPGLIWGGISARKVWPPLAELDAYSCVLDFHILSAAPLAELQEHFRYVSDQLQMAALSCRDLGGTEPEEKRVACPCSADGGAAAGAPAPGSATGQGDGDLSPRQQERQAAAVIISVQREILSLPEDVAWIAGRIRGAAASLQGCLRATGSDEALPGLESAADAAVSRLCAAPLQEWLDEHLGREAGSPTVPEQFHPAEGGLALAAVNGAAPPEPEVKFGRRAEDAFLGAKSIKVDQAKIDRLMNLIGEMVVAKNALPYLAGRAEEVFGVRELSREIKAQYAVINRIAEEMQDSIMQVRMMPVSFVFQRFPRLVRDISQKLGKEVHLVLEGEETEADKTIIEALGDPLVHIVRNSLDHGIELPQTRVAAGKSGSGTLTIRATQEADRVVIEIRDDGKGIDPEVIKRKAYQKGLLDEEQLARITDQEAVNLVFAPGFSTAEVVSDLSGRGVGMDVVRTAIEQVNGTVHLASEKGRGTTLQISLPLSMAVTNVMIVESNGQMFGVPMDAVVETVRVPAGSIKTIKRSMAAVLRGRIVPLKGLNSLLGLPARQRANDEEEFAVLVVNAGGGAVGILVDDFHQTVDIILKPMTGVLAGLAAYSGSALLGDGSVLMVLNMKEVV